MDKKEIEQNNGEPSMTIDKSWEIAFIGLEIGGTNLKAGIIGEDGKCSELKVERLAKDSSARQPKALVDSLVALGQKILDEQGITWQEIRRIGVACPGQIKRETGVVVGASNFPTWNNVPLAELVKERTGRPTTVLNDASAAAAAEFANRSSHRNIAVLTLGTGVGLGVVQSGHLMVGTRGLVEGGHMIVEPGPNGRLCPCGQRGCLEVYASATAVVEIYSERMQCHALERQGSKPPSAARDVGKGQQHVSLARPKAIRPERRASYSAVADRIRELEKKTSSRGVSESLLNPRSSSPEDIPKTDEIHGVEPEPVAAVSINGGDNAITSEEVFVRARQGDEIAMSVVDETCSYIGIACINICRILDPAAILLTGGLSRAEGLIDKVREAFANRGWSILPHECEIALASTSGSSSSGVLGAAYAAMSDYARDVRTQEVRQVHSSVTSNDEDRALSEGVAGASGHENDADSGEENAVNYDGVAAHESGSGLMDCTAISREGPDALAETSDPSRKRSDNRKMGWLLAGISIGIFIGVGVCHGAGAFRPARGGTARVAER